MSLIRNKASIQTITGCEIRCRSETIFISVILCQVFLYFSAQQTT